MLGESEDMVIFRQDYLVALFMNSYYNDSKKHILTSNQRKVLNSLSDLHGSCNWEIECPYKEDECSQECFNSIQFYFFNSQFLHLAKCFDFLFNNSEFFSIDYIGSSFKIDYLSNEINNFSSKQTSKFYFDNSELKPGLSKPNFSAEIDVNKTITVKNSKASFTDKF